MTTQAASIKTLLAGANAFYIQEDYLTTLKSELDAPTCPSTAIYSYQVEHKALRIAKTIGSIIIFPIGIHHLLHLISGKVAVVPAATPQLLGYQPRHAELSRQRILLNSAWKIKRIMVRVDGYKIDGAIIGTASTLNNGRWLLYSNGNGEFYEDVLQSYSFRTLLATLNFNGVVYNYSGVSRSSRLPSKTGIKKCYRAMLNFIEDKINGIGANFIIGLGHSLGGAVQSEALTKHPLKPNIRYLFISRQTFGTLSAAARSFHSRALGVAVKLLGWNLNAHKSSLKLRATQIILQSAQVDTAQDISKAPHLIRGDGVIEAVSSLALSLLTANQAYVGEKYFLGIPEDHNEDLFSPGEGSGYYLTDLINNLLEKEED